MSSYSRRTFGLGLFLALAACGFEPVHAPSASDEAIRGRIVVAPPVDEEGYTLVNRLAERLDQPTRANLELTANIFLTEDAVGFLPDGTISRYNVLARVQWALTRASDGSTVLSGEERSFTGYSATSTTVATIFARRDAHDRLMVILADRIAADIFAADLSK